MDPRLVQLRMTLNLNLRDRTPSLKCWIVIVWLSFLFETGSDYVTYTGPCFYLLTWNYRHEPPHLAERQDLKDMIRLGGLCSHKGIDAVIVEMRSLSLDLLQKDEYYSPPLLNLLSFCFP